MSEYLPSVKIEPLEEGGYLATSDDLLEFLAQRRTVSETLEIAQDVACKIVDSYLDHRDPFRAHLIYCVAAVGVSHNRFFVMNIMQSLFDLEKDDAAWMAIEHRFLDADEFLRRNIGEHLDLNKLPSSVRTLFRVGKA